MTEIILMELISIISFLYSLWLMFAFFGPINQIVLVFLWTVSVSLFFALGQSKRKIYNLSILLLLLPIFFCREKSSVFFIIASALFIFIYIKRSLLRGNHYLYANSIKKIYLFYIVVIYFRMLLYGFQGSVGHATPFIIVNILSSIMLTRTIRHVDYNMEIDKIRKNNIKHLVFIGIIFIIATFDKLRNSLWTGVSSFFRGILLIFFYPFYIIANWLASEPVENTIEITEIDIIGKLAPEISGPKIEVNEEVAVKLIKAFTIMKNILTIILLSIIIFIIYKIIMRMGNRNYTGENFTEEREYIGRQRKKSRIFNREKYPKEFKEQIRYYYRRYLEKLEKTDIEILETDTSFEINEKAEEIFHEDIENIRDIYINARYSKKDVDRDMVEGMKTLYKRL